MTSSTADIDAVARPRAIVAGHGELPQGLVNAVDCISGCGAVFIPLSNYGLAGSDIEAKLRQLADEHGIRVFFTDLPGGSATIAVRRLMRTDSSLILITGTNLSTLLEFVFQPDAPVGDAARHAADKGRATLVVTGDDEPPASAPSENR